MSTGIAQRPQSGLGHSWTSWADPAQKDKCEDSCQCVQRHVSSPGLGWVTKDSAGPALASGSCPVLSACEIPPDAIDGKVIPVKVATSPPLGQTLRIPPSRCHSRWTTASHSRSRLHMAGRSEQRHADAGQTGPGLTKCTPALRRPEVGSLFVQPRCLQSCDASGKVPS